jgi:hypothetical protein
MAGAQSPKVRVLKLDQKRINNPDLLDAWDGVWMNVSELRNAITRAREAGQVVTTQMMQAYEQARNGERQFFWDNFYEQDES